MPFILPFETEIVALDQHLASLAPDSPEHAAARAELHTLEQRLYPQLSALDTFLLSGHPLRPKTLDYVRYIFQNARLAYDPDIRGDHLLIGGEGRIEIDGKPRDIIIIGQQTGPSSNREELFRLSHEEYRGWNQGMGFPDSYRKAVYFMDLAEQRGWPVVVFVDTPGADPSEYSEEEGQAFAINEVIHKTTALRVPNLAYIISLGASGGAIAITPTNRTIMNEYATYMVISPGGCASILFRNRNPESIRKAADGLRLTSSDALQQGTVDEVVPEGLHPGHRYPRELLESAKHAVTQNIAQLLQIPTGQAEEVRRKKFFAMGVWAEGGEERNAESLSILAASQRRTFDDVYAALTEFMMREGSDEPPAREETSGGCEGDAEADAEAAQGNGRLRVARMIYAIARRDRDYLTSTLGRDPHPLTATQWARLHEVVLERRYGHRDGAATLHPTGRTPIYRRLHPIDWIRWLTDQGTFREFEKTIRYVSVDQLSFPEYESALTRGIARTGLQSGTITGAGLIRGHRVVLAINNFGLVGSSLCDEIGEKFRYAAEQALRHETPFVSIAMGGGARMQEGTPSMHRNIPKAQHALNLLEEAGIPHISIIADPTLGGTAISYGLRGDYLIVVRGSANIGFSGRRVVEQFQRRKVSEDFQHGSWLKRRGFVDERVATEDMAERVSELLLHVANGGKLADLQTRTPRKWRPTIELTPDKLRGAAVPETLRPTEPAPATPADSSTSSTTSTA